MNGIRHRDGLPARMVQRLASRLASLLLVLPNWKLIDYLIAVLVRAAQPLPWAPDISGLPTSDVAKMARARGGLRAIALSHLEQGVGPSDLMSVVSEGYLVQPAARLIALHPDAAARSETIYQSILAQAEVGPQRLATAFLVTWKTAETLQTSHASTILRHALVLANQPIDPYQPPGLHVLARQAAAAIVAEHPELDPQLHEILRGSPGRSVIEIIASGLHVRRRGIGNAVADALAAWRPDRARARSFLKMIDARFEAGPVRPDRAKRSLLRSRISSAAILLAAILVPALVSVVGAMLATRTLDIQSPAHPSLTAGLGVLGVLFAVDIYTSEQTAARLPGVLARYASRARSLVTAYAAAFTMIGAVVVERLWPASAPESTWTATLGAAMFVGASAFLLRAVVARLHPANAAAAFIRNRGWAVTRGGLVLNAIRIESLKGKTLVAGLRSVRLVASPVSTEVRHRISPRRRGFLLLRTRAMHRLTARAAWQEGRLTLNVSHSIGTIVRAHEEVASVTSDEDTVPTSGELRFAERAIRVRSARPVDAVSEAAAVLVELAGDLMDSGDHQAADRVGQSLVELLDLHLSGVHHRHIPLDGDEALPVVPPLVTALSGLASRAAGLRGRPLELMLGLIDDVLHLAREDDHAPVILMSVAQSSQPSRHVSSELLRLASRRALELKDEAAMVMIRRHLEREVAGGSTEHLQTGADVSALAMWLDYFRATRYWEWLRSILDLTRGDHVRIAVRVGAAALEARVFSVALDIVVDLLSADPRNVEEASRLADDPAFIASERLRAELGGGYLGASPGDAVSRFAVFLKTAGTAVSG